MARNDPEVLVRNGQVDHPVVVVAIEHSFGAFQRDGPGLGCEGGRLAECAPEAAASRGKKQAKADDGAEWRSERNHHRRMGQILQRAPQRLGDLVLAVSYEATVEVGADFRRQHAVVAAPDLGDPRAAGFGDHVQRAWVSSR